MLRFSVIRSIPIDSTSSNNLILIAIQHLASSFGSPSWPLCCLPRPSRRRTNRCASSCASPITMSRSETGRRRRWSPLAWRVGCATLRAWPTIGKTAGAAARNIRCSIPTTIRSVARRASRAGNCCAGILIFGSSSGALAGTEYGLRRGRSSAHSRRYRIKTISRVRKMHSGLPILLKGKFSVAQRHSGTAV